MSFSAPKVYTMPGFKTNVKYFQVITNTIKSKDFKQKAQELVDLYVAIKKWLTVKRQETPYSISANHVTNDLVRQRLNIRR
jgi:hypothetical protein